MSFWYQGLAELNNYELKQSRYGEIRDGQAVLIFVTEDLNTEKQVKADNPDRVNSTKVMKLNYTKKFQTGIYNYSIMSSIFTPIDRTSFPKTLKVSNSNQDWCGHTFMQLNLTDKGYDLNQFSYFESESDQQMKIKADFLEDEIWNLIRIAPKSLPEGDVNMFPSLEYVRLKHKKNEALKAKAKLSDKGEYSVYEIVYEERSLSIEFENVFPHRILGWTEKYIQEDGKSPENLITTAKLKKSLMLDYWNRNSVADSVYLNKLGLK